MLPRIAYQTFVAFRNSSLDIKELQQLRDRKVRRVVRLCYDYVPYYRHMIRGLGITPEDIRGVSDLARLPVTTRADIVKNYPSRITVRGASVWKEMSTSGTTGQPLKVRWGPGLCDVLIAQHIRRVFKMGVRPWARFASIETANRATRGNGIPSSARKLKTVSKVLFGSFNVVFPTLHQLKLGLGRSNLGDVCDALRDFQPEILYSRASHARRVGRMMRASGTKVSPRIMICSGDFMSNATRADLIDDFETDVYNSYGCREIGGVGTECYVHQGLHVNADNLVHEVVRRGEAMDVGESGSLLLTSLENEAMPLLRYEIGDASIQGEVEKCACGSVFPRIQTILGRSSDGLVASDGIMIPPGTVCDELESGLSLRDFQVIQERPGKIVVKVRGWNNNVDTAARLRSSLEHMLVAPQEVELETWGDDDMPPKYRPVLSNVPQR